MLKAQTQFCVFFRQIQANVSKCVKAEKEQISSIQSRVEVVEPCTDFYETEAKSNVFKSQSQYPALYALNSTLMTTSLADLTQNQTKSVCSISPQGR